MLPIPLLPPKCHDLMCDADGKVALPTNIQTQKRQLIFFGPAEPGIEPRTLGLKKRAPIDEEFPIWSILTPTHLYFVKI